MNKKKSFLIVLGLMVASLLVLAGCSTGETNKDSKGDVHLVYVEWDTEVASTHVVGQVLEDLGYNVELTPLDNAIMWESVAKGEADGMVAAWLPNTHGEHYAKFEDQVENLGANLPTAKIGLVVPEYMDVDSIEDLTKEADQTIVGIEPGAGVVMAAEAAMAAYPNLADWTLDTSSSAVMTVALEQAIKEEKEVIVTGWSPHWKFSKYDLKYLADPQGVFGDAETINTMVRKDLKTDLPEVHKVLDNFEWSEDQMEEMLLKINDGEDPKEAAKDFVANNKDLVATWTE